MQDINYVTAILAIVFAYPLLTGLILKFSSHSVKKDINSLESSILSVASLFAGIFISKVVLTNYRVEINRFIKDYFPDYFKSTFINNQIILYISLAVVCMILIKIILTMLIGVLNHMSIYLFLDTIESLLENSGDFKKRILGLIMKVPRAIFNIVIVSIIFYVISFFSLNPNLNKSLQGSEPYKYVCQNIIVPIADSDVAKSLPLILNDSMKIVIKNPDSNDGTKPASLLKNSALIYYNGVTLEEGVKSNYKIDSFAKGIAKSAVNSRQKVRILYDWVGSHIYYDKKKAEMVEGNDFGMDSGAIPTYNTRKGICFDYSCLFVAMCRTNNIKVRLVTGKGFNGSSWVNHAWNMAYIPEEKKWINVDTTFHNYGDYFDNENFRFDHSDAQIAGEW